MSITTELRVVTVKLPEGDLRRIPVSNRSGFIREAVSEKLARMTSTEWAPRTEAGKRRRLLRQRFIKQGGELLDTEGIAAEVRQRRGGLA
jgi:hypothetical protein